MSIGGFINDNYRRQGAASETCDLLDCKGPIRRSVVIFRDFQFPVNRFDEFVGTFDMTCGPYANPDSVSSGGPQPELFVESCDSLYSCGGDVSCFRQALQCFRRQVAPFALEGLENGNKVFRPAFKTPDDLIRR